MVGCHGFSTRADFSRSGAEGAERYDTLTRSQEDLLMAGDQGLTPLAIDFRRFAAGDACRVGAGD